MKFDLDDEISRFAPTANKFDLDKEVQMLAGANDDDNFLQANYHSILANAGNAIHTIQDAVTRSNKPEYYDTEEWIKKQSGLTKAISNFGRNLEKEHARQYSPWSANRLTAGVAGTLPYMVGLGVATTMAAKSGNYKAIGDAANIAVRNAGVFGKYTPQAAKAAEIIAPAATVGAIRTVPEAGIEWQSAYDGYIEDAKRDGSYVKGVTEKKAEEVSNAVFRDNMALLGGTNLLETLAITTKLPLSKVKSAMAKIMGGATMNAGEEMAQQIFPKAEAGKDWSLTDDDVLESGAIGLITGGGMQGAGMVANHYLGDNTKAESAPTNLNEKQAEAWGEAQWVSQQTGVPAEFIYRQWAHESGNFTSQLARENNNFGGLTQVEANGEENKQPDGGNYYKQYNNMHEYAQDYINSFLRHYDGVGNVKSIEDFAQVLKDNGYYGDSVENYINGLKGIEAPTGDGIRKDYANNSGDGETNFDSGVAQKEKELLNQLVNEKIEIAAQNKNMDEWSFLTDNQYDMGAILERYPDIAEQLKKQREDSPSDAGQDETLHHSDLLDDLHVRDYTSLNNALKNGDVTTKMVGNKYNFIAKTPAGESVVQKIEATRKKIEGKRATAKGNMSTFEKYMDLARQHNIIFDAKTEQLGKKGDTTALSKALKILKKNGVNVRKAILDDVIKAAKQPALEQKNTAKTVQPTKQSSIIDRAIAYYERTNNPTEKMLLETLVNNNNIDGLKLAFPFLSENTPQIPLFTPPKTSTLVTPGKKAAISNLSNVLNNITTQKYDAMAAKQEGVRGVVQALDNLKERKSRQLANEIADAKEQTPVRRQSLLNVLNKVKNDKQIQSTASGLSKIDTGALIRVAENVADMPMTNQIKQIVGKELARRGILPPAVAEGVNFDRAMLDIAKKKKSQYTPTDTQSQQRLNQLTGDKSPNIIIPEKGDSISDAMRWPYSPSTPTPRKSGVLKTAQEKVDENAFHSAVNRGDFNKAIEIAEQTGNIGMANILRNRAKFSFDNRHERDRERMRATEKAAKDFVPEGYKGTASGVVEGLAEHEVQSVKRFMEGELSIGHSMEDIEKYLRIAYNKVKANKSDGMSTDKKIEHMRFLQGAIGYVREQRKSDRQLSIPDAHINESNKQGRNERSFQGDNRIGNERSGLSSNDSQINQDRHSENQGAFSIPKTYEQRLLDAARENGVKADYAKLQKHIEAGIPRATKFLEEALFKKGIDPKQIKFSYNNQEKTLTKVDNKQPTFTNEEIVQMVKLTTGTKIVMVPKGAKVLPRLQRIADFGKMMGCPVRYYDGVSNLHGFHFGGVTYINRRSAMPHNKVFWHESFHWLRNNNEKLYQDMVKRLKKMNAFSQEKLKAYREKTGRFDLSNEETLEEMMADTMMDVAKRVGLMKGLGKTDSSLAERFVAWIRETMAKFHDFFTGYEHGFSPRGKKAMVEAFTNLARDMVDGNGNRIFLLEPGRKLILARNHQPVSTALENLTPAFSAKDMQKPWHEDVEEKTLNNITQVRNELKDYLAQHGETIHINTPERQALRNKIADELYGNGAKNKNSEIYIVLGPPAAGKSSVAEPLAKKTGSMIIDSDMAKERLPEFNNGRLAGAVHEESDFIMQQVLGQAMVKGDNIILPVVGRTYDGLAKKVGQFKDNGYKVHIIHVDLPINKAAQRAVTRFEETGRFVDPEYVSSIGYSTRENYDKIKNMEGVVGYEAYSNDVPRGGQPVCLESVGEIREGRRKALYGNNGEGKTEKGATTEEPKLSHSDKQGGFSMPKYSYKSNAEHQSFIKQLMQPFKSSKGRELNRKAVKNALEELLDMKIRAGHMDGDISSIFNETRGIIRSRNSFDWENILPHVGSVVAKRLKLNNTGKVSENYIARWLMDGALSEENSQVAQDFKKAMRKEPEFADKLTEIRNMFDEMRSRAGDLQIQSTISNDKETALVDTLKEYRQKIYDEFIEEFGPIKRMVDQIEKKIGKPLSFGTNPYLAFRMWRGRFGKAIALIEGNHDGAIRALKTYYPSVNFDNFKTINMILKHIGANKDKEVLKKFGTYCLAKHARDIHAHNQKGDEQIVTPPEWSLENCEYTIKKYEQENLAFIQAQKDLVNFSNVTMQIMRESGLLSNEQYYERTKKWKNYVPLFREFEDNENISFGDSTKRLHGSTKNIINPIESIIHNTYKFINVAEKNKAKNTLRMLCQINDTGEFLNEVDNNNPNDKTCFSVMVDGKKKWFETDPAIVAAVNNMRPDQTNLFWKIISYPVKLLRAGSTFMSPEFVLRNPFRDYADALIYSKHGFIKPTDLLHGFVSAIKADDLYWEFQVNGGAQAAAVSADRNYAQFTMNKMMQKNSKADILKPWKWLDYVQAVSEFSEYATRLSYFKKTQEGLTKTNPAIKKSLCLQEAAFEARDLMDFARGGKSSRKWNQWAIFANASLQGWDKTFRTFNFKDPKNRKQALAAMVRIGMYTLLPTLAFWFWNRDDDRYKNLPHWVKDTHYTFSIGDKTFRIPKGQDAMNIILSGELERFLNYAYTKDPKALDKKLEPIKQMLPGLAPTMVIPIAEAIANYSFFKEGSIVPQYQQKLTPKMQSGPYTTSISKYLGEKLNIAPRKLDHLLFGYTGSLGRLATGAYDTLSGEKQLNLSIEELPLIRGLTISPYKHSKYVNEYYEERNKQEALYNELKATGKRPEGFDLKIHTRLKSIAKPMQHLSKLERALMNNEEMPVDIKKQKQDEIQQRRIKLLKKAMGIQ